MLRWLVYEHGIEPHVTVFDKSTRRNGTFSREDFAYDRGRDVYVCPAGKTLTTRGTAPRSFTARASSRAMPAPSNPAAAPRNPRARFRALSSRGRATWRATAHSDAGRTSRRQRQKVEILFAHLKRILRLDRLRLRGPCGAHDEFLLAATAQNLRKLAKLITPPTPLPAT